MATSAERPGFPRRRLITGALPRRGSARNRPSGPGPHFESARGDRLSPSTSKEPATVVSLAPTARSSIGKQLGLDAAKCRADGRGLISAGQLAAGWVSFEIGGAIELFDEEVRHNPDDAGPYLKLGRFLYDIGYSKKAIVVLREAQRFRLDDEVGQEIEAAIEDCLNSAHDEEAEERSDSRAAVDNPDNAEWQHVPAATRDKTGNLPAVTANDRQAAPDLGIEARINQGKGDIAPNKTYDTGWVKEKAATPPWKRGLSGRRQRSPLPGTGHTETRPESPPLPPTVARAVETLAAHFALSAKELLACIAARETTQSRPRWEARHGDDFELSPEEFVAKHYAAEKTAVTPRPVWREEGPYGNRPAEFIAMAYAPEMKAGTLHRKMIANDTETGRELVAKLTSWLRSHPMPENVDIPTYPEWNSRQHAACRGHPAIREGERLAAVGRRRPTEGGQKDIPLIRHAGSA